MSDYSALSIAEQVRDVRAHYAVWLNRPESPNDDNIVALARLVDVLAAAIDSLTAENERLTSFLEASEQQVYGELERLQAAVAQTERFYLAAEADVDRLQRFEAEAARLRAALNRIDHFTDDKDKPEHDGEWMAVIEGMRKVARQALAEPTDEERA